MVGIFALECIILIVQEVRITDSESFHYWPRHSWEQPSAISISQVISTLRFYLPKLYATACFFHAATVLSDALLVLAPLWIIHSVKIDAAIRSRLLAVFCISIITTLVGIIHVVVAAVVGGLPSLLFAILEVNSVGTSFQLPC